MQQARTWYQKLEGGSSGSSTEEAIGKRDIFKGFQEIGIGVFFVG